MTTTSTLLYRPMPVRITNVSIENDARDLKTFRLAFSSARDEESFVHRCGQFAMLSIPGTGEMPIGIASSPLDKGYVEFTVKRYGTGLVTSALHNLAEGDTIGLRGPYGNGFDMQDLEGKNVVVIGGGFAFTTLRAAIRYMLHDTKRSLFGRITILYGARTPGELLYKSELREWEQRGDLTVWVTVDNGDAAWSGIVGMVPTVLSERAPSAENGVALVCGPPIMLKFTMPPLRKLGFPPERIITSLERKMSCGIGKCGRCGVGNKYVCADGPVFSLAQLGHFADSGL